MEKTEAIAIAFAAARSNLDSTYHSRLHKALDIALDGDLGLVETGIYRCKGSGDAEYTINREGGNWTCTCPDHQHRAPEGRCKHILAIMLTCKSEKAMESQPAPASAATSSHEFAISISAKGTVHGIPNTMITLRGNTMDEIKANAERVRAGSTCLLNVFDGSDRKPFVPEAARELYGEA